ncbi:hypothetical protein FRB93_012240 [Tulasnella sp. JGI-2019a]|nr:hypothetical protein FRB93_012240 [Tulasnella sp. JGI-2019a]
MDTFHSSNTTHSPLHLRPNEFLSYHQTLPSQFGRSDFGGSAYFPQRSCPNLPYPFDQLSLPYSPPELSQMEDLVRAEVAYRMNMSQLPKHLQPQANTFWPPPSVIPEPTVMPTARWAQDVPRVELHRDQLERLEPSPGSISASPWTPTSTTGSSSGWPQQDTLVQLTDSAYVHEPTPHRSPSLPGFLQFEQEQQYHSDNNFSFPSTSLFHHDEDLHRYEFGSSGVISAPAARTHFELDHIDTLFKRSPTAINSSSPPLSFAPALGKAFISPAHVMVTPAEVDHDLEEVSANKADGTGNGEGDDAKLPTQVPIADVLGSPLLLDSAVDDDEGGVKYSEDDTPMTPTDNTLILYTSDAASKETLHFRRRCFNCHAIEPPSWRRSTLHLGKIVCNKCGLYERTHSRSRAQRFDEMPRRYNKSIITGTSPRKASVSPKARARKFSQASATSTSSSSIGSTTGGAACSATLLANLQTRAELTTPSFVSRIPRPMIRRRQTERIHPSTTTPWSTTATTTKKKAARAVHPPEIFKLAQNDSFDVPTSRARALTGDPYQHLPRLGTRSEVDMETGWHQVRIEDMMSTFSACPSSSPVKGVRRGLAVEDA